MRAATACSSLFALSTVCGENVIWVFGTVADAIVNTVLAKGEFRNPMFTPSLHASANTLAYSLATVGSSKTSTWLELTYSPVTEKLVDPVNTLTGTGGLDESCLFDTM